MSAICDAHNNKVHGEQLYNPGEDRKSDELESRCGRENQHPVEGALRPRLSSCSWRENAGMRTMSQRGWAPRPPVEQPRRTRKKRCYSHKSGGVNMLQFCSVSNSPSHTTLSIKWEVDFSRKLCRSSLLCRFYDSACICICVCIVVHGYATRI